LNRHWKLLAPVAVTVSVAVSPGDTA